MQLSKKQKHLKNMISFSMIMYVFFGFISYFFSSMGIVHFIWAISSFFMIIASSLLGSKLTRDGHDIPAAGFIVLSIAQAMSYGFIATHDVGKEQFGAVVSIFVPGLFLISFYDVVPLFIRILGFIAAASFSVLAMGIYSGSCSEEFTTVLTSASYLSMNIAILGWAWLIYKNKV